MRHIIITILMLGAFKSSYACDCILYPVETYINKVDVIFTGTVIELVEKVDTTKFYNTPQNRKYFENKAYKVKVLIVERLKTGELKSDTVEFTSDFTNCDPIYELNEAYLFFANKAEGGKYKMAHCTRWGLLKDSQENIRKLKVELKIK